MFRLADRLDHVGDRFNAINGELVTIGRGEDTTPNVTASPIIRPAEEFMPGVAVTRIEYQSWGMDVADFELDGSAVTPEPGDTITRADGSKYRLISLAGNEPPYRYMTSARRRYLLHSEMIQGPT